MKKVILIFALSLSLVSFSQTDENLNNRFCKRIKVEKDKFTNETKSRSPYDGSGLNLIKYVTNESTNIYLSINVEGNTLNYNAKGVYILLENGEKLSFPDIEISVDTNSSHRYSKWKYSAFIELSDENIKLLLSSRITDVRLYI